MGGKLALTALVREHAGGRESVVDVCQRGSVIKSARKRGAVTPSSRCNAGGTSRDRQRGVVREILRCG
jgi:hypothetical protein